VLLGITFVEVGSRVLWALLLALCAFGVAGVGPAAAVGKDACTTFSPGGETATALSVGDPAGSVLVGSSSARLGALIGSAAGQATYLVDYGSSVDYGLCTTAVLLPAGSGQQSVQVMLTGLVPQTTYHFAVVATSGTDTASSGDQTFTTLPAGEIPQGATINGVAVGGLSEAAALSAVRQLRVAPARLAIGKRYWSVVRAKLGAEIDASRIALALQALPGQALTAPTSVDAHRLASYLAVLNHRYEQPVRREVVRLVGQHVLVAPARSGIRIDTQRARAAITTYLTQGRLGVLRLPVRRAPAPEPRQQKVVVIRLRAQTLTAYLDGRPVLTAPVTTGRPALPTPVGTFYVHSRFSPYVFTSPWPKGSAYWYPPTPATWAMYFYDNDFLHDDPGEPASAFGSGSENGPYASHGCVHVPHDAMAFLYQWLPVGATVIVAQT
jgi:L,D-transpeptidase catalytic domain/Putative peptidoglycan binding domain